MWVSSISSRFRSIHRIKEAFFDRFKQVLPREDRSRKHQRYHECNRTVFPRTAVADPCHRSLHSLWIDFHRECSSYRGWALVLVRDSTAQRTATLRGYALSAATAIRPPHSLDAGVVRKRLAGVQSPGLGAS